MLTYAALLLCEVHGFVDGAVLLLEKKGLYKEVRMLTYADVC
jgi:hypothetical protein